uniref:Putative secreted peptide n=1 Tax=Anopheles braziliensis TaxID=58242 RepID=A0A2M3ZQH8_9DIPT
MDGRWSWLLLVPVVSLFVVSTGNRRQPSRVLVVVAVVAVCTKATVAPRSEQREKPKKGHRNTVVVVVALVTVQPVSKGSAMTSREGGSWLPW